MKSMIAVLLVTATIVLAVDPVVVKVAIEGKCPDVPFVKDFDSTKFTGKWYSIKETAKATPCVTYQLSETTPYHYEAVVSPLNFSIEFEKKNVEDFADGLSVSLKINPYVDGGVLKVFSTDYENYGGVYVCKQVDVEKYYQTIFFWSRTTSLREEAFVSLNEVLAKYEIVYDLYAIKHDNCEVVIVA